MSTLPRKSSDILKQQTTATAKRLLGDLKDTPVDKLSAGVARSEGVNGSTLEPIYARRSITCYTITESELQQIGLANLAITAAASIGTAFLTFSLDLFKDTLLSESIPPLTQEVLAVAQPILLVVGIALWLSVVALTFWKNGMIKTIKADSTSHQK